MQSLVSSVRIFVFLQALSLSLCAAQSDSVVVHLHPATGYGPFNPSIRMSLSGETSGAWERAIAEVRGVPVDLHGFSIRYMNLQADQFVYQSYRAGLLDPAFALDMIARNAYDTTKLTPKYVSQDVPVVVGIDKQGNTVYVIDTKDDHSFWGKDRIVVPPFRADDLTRAQMDSLNDLIEKPSVTFEFYDGKKARTGEVLVRLCPYVSVPPGLPPEVRARAIFGIGTFEYRRGVFRSGERDYMCAVSNGFQSGVYGGKQDEFAFFPSADSSTVSVATSLRYRRGDRVEIADEVLRIASVAVDGSALTLRREKTNPAAEGIAVGSVARDFQLRSLSGDPVSLGQFRGKHVLLDFWSPGSPLCAREIPYLNDIHAAYGGSKIEVLGLALGVGPPLPEFMAGHRMTWTQVPVSDTSRVLKDYGVGGYPVTFIIDPQGKIVGNSRLTGQEVFEAVAGALGDSASLLSLISKGNIEFRCDAGTRKTVEVAGDFTGWLPLPMYRSGGGFVRRAQVPPGRHRYVLIIDGERTLDVLNPDTETSSSGKVDNILVVN
jgi:peroxiredoxin